jgi:hypothetical protein
MDFQLLKADLQSKFKTVVLPLFRVLSVFVNFFGLEQSVILKFRASGTSIFGLFYSC